jgi:7,8-dihydropterin-6-yl-methyl-4-(beta-D-ribofuranosyl)aminobenzene 5'-phosphate synthase
VVNAIGQAQAISGVERVHALSGGFHLAPYDDDYVQETVAGLKEMDIDYLIRRHCRGETLYDRARAGMPGNVLRSYTGMCFLFS